MEVVILIAESGFNNSAALHFFCTRVQLKIKNPRHRLDPASPIFLRRSIVGGLEPIVTQVWPASRPGVGLLGGVIARLAIEWLAAEKPQSLLWQLLTSLALHTPTQSVFIAFFFRAVCGTMGRARPEPHHEMKFFGQPHTRAPTPLFFCHFH